MINLFLKSTCQKAQRSLLPFRHKSIQYFTSMKPQDNNDKNKPEVKQQKKMKVKFGIKNPLKEAMQKQLKIKLQRHFMLKKQWIKKKQQQQLLKQKFNQSNQKQDQKQKDKAENQKNINQATAQVKENLKKSLKKAFIVGISIYLFLSLINSDHRQVQPNQFKNIQLVLQQIQRGPDQSQVFVSRNMRDQIYLTCTIGKNKHYQISKMNQEQLVYFLEKLQKIRNGTTEVNFVPRDLPLMMDTLFLNIVRVLIYGGLMFLAYRIYKGFQSSSNMGGITNLFDTNKFQPIKSEDIRIQFSDVAGMHQAKFQITQFVQFLKRPDKYIQMGAKVPKGALLTGPPGTGKTLLAKACAGEAGVPFFSVSGSDFVEKYSGLGASRVRSLFDKAQKVAPSIIFIDQIDAIGKKRDSGPFSNQQRDNTLNQLLVRMDGFDTKNKVIVMAATNRKDMLDPALLRPGRFDRSVQIGLPNLEQRGQILKVHLKKVKFDQSLTIQQLSKKIARITPGFSGAELANICNQAAILSARDKLTEIPIVKFQKATQRVMAGLEKRNMFSPQQKQMLSLYEAGKAVANWFTEGADPVIKISILPFSKSKAGYSHSIKDQTALHTKQQLQAKICCYLAGRSTEKYFKGFVTTNGNTDLQRAKKIVHMIVTKFGMSDALKMYAFPDFDFTRKPYSQKTQLLIDQQIAKITEECQKKVQILIKQKQHLILQLKQKLLLKQTLNHNEIKQVLGDRPFGANQNYEQFLKDKQQQQVPKNMQEPGAGVAAS